MTDMPTQWRDLLWQRPPQQALIRVDLREKGAIHIEEQRFTMEAGRQRVVALQRTLTELGIPQTLILMLKRAENGEQYLQTSTTVDALQ